MKTKTAKAKTRISRITIGRLYNLGNYEHIRYEISVDVAEGDSALKAFQNVSYILSSANPKPPCQKYEYDRAVDQLEKPETWLRNVTDKKQRKEHLKQMTIDAKKLIAKWEAWTKQRRKSIALLDDIGATSVHKDAKEDWHDDDMEF